MITRTVQVNEDPRLTLIFDNFKMLTNKKVTSLVINYNNFTIAGNDVFIIVVERTMWKLHHNIRELAGRFNGLIPKSDINYIVKISGI